MSKQKLVVIGNGMAGARAVEEVLARGGADSSTSSCSATSRTATTTASCCPTSSAARRTPSEIFINPLDWYEENGITLHAGARVVDIDRAARGRRRGQRRPPALRQAADRHRQPRLHSADGRRERHRGQDASRASSASAPSTTATASSRLPRQSRRAAVIGGGLLGLEAARGLLNHGCEVHVVHLAGHLMEMQLDRAGRRDPEGQPWRRWASTSICRKQTTEILGGDTRHRPCIQGRHDARLRHGGGLRRHQAQRRDRHALRADRRARHRGRQPHALGRRPGRLRRRRMRPAPRPRLRPGRAAVGAGEGVRRPHHRARPATPPITAPSSRPSSR